MKTCKICNETKGFDEFHNQKSASDGCHTYCKDCTKQLNKVYKATHKEELNEKGREYYHNNKRKCLEKSKDYKRQNKENLRVYRKEWYKNNRCDELIYAAKVRADKLNASPAWANDGYIRLFYEGAIMEGERTKEGVEVDHTIPLNHPLVCGLHCEYNLQLLYTSANRKKARKYNVMTDWC